MHIHNAQPNTETLQLHEAAEIKRSIGHQKSYFFFCGRFFASLIHTVSELSVRH